MGIFSLPTEAIVANANYPVFLLFITKALFLSEIISYLDLKSSWTCLQCRLN